MFCLVKILCVLYVVIFGTRLASSRQDPISISLKGRLKNILIFDHKLYIGSTDRIFVLNEDLSKNQTANTCGMGKMNCGNINQILLLHHKRKELLVCGTGNEGICDVRSLKDIDHVLRNSSGPKSSLKVSMDISRPAQGLITKDGNLTIAVTFGKGIDKRTLSTVEKTKTTYDYAISTRYFVDFNPVSSIAGTKVLKLEIEPSRFKDYVIYYKAGFQVKWYTYFVTNQKNYVGGSKYVSKLVRLCQSDTNFNSYTDIAIQCDHNGTIYNLIQDAKVLETQHSIKYADTGGIFIGVFGRGDYPEIPSSESVICLSKLKDLDEEIMLAKKRHALRCDNYDDSKRYLPSFKSSCFNEMDLKFRDYDFTCENAYQSFIYVIGNSSFLMKSSHKVPAEDGLVTALDGALTSDGNIEIIVGTSTGNILQMTLSGYGSPITLFSKIKVTPPVRRVLIKDEDTLYAISEEKVFLIHRANCSEISSCDEAMKVHDPLCGWCVYKQRMTRKADCLDGTNHWISSLKNCNLKLSITPSTIPLRISRNTKISVTVMLRQLPEPLPGDLYQCTLLNGTVTIGTLKAKKNGSSFKCTLPRIHDYLEASLKISVRTISIGNVVLSEGPILFFQCEDFTRCGDCISKTSQDCQWCTQETRCQRKGSPCSTELIASREICPSLADMKGRVFVHSGVWTAVKFDTKHLPKANPTAYLYTCEIPAAAKLSAAVRVGDSIFCNISISSSSGVPKQDFKVRVSYLVEGQPTAEIDDEFDNFVTVYNCSLLAKDYSQCQALNKSKYNCSWCPNRNTCGYEDEQCAFGTNPAPTVIKILPRNGSTMGNTRITVSGINLGTKIADIESVEVANIPCELSKDENDFLVISLEDFESKVPTQIVCYTRPSVNARAGFVNVIVNGMKSSSYIEYSYKIPTVTKISPKFGPIAGGTSVTLFGQNLGIGNRNISVMLGNKQCLEPMVKSGLPQAYMFSNNCMIVCTVDRGYSVNATTLDVTLDGKEVVYMEPIQFIFVANPEVFSAVEKKAFLSGGTKISIVGRYLNHSFAAKATLNYEDEIQVWKCEIESSAVILCNVPRAPESLRNELLKRTGTTKKLECIRVIIVLHLDNVQAEVEVEYYQDPIIDNIPGENNVVIFSSDNRRLTITGGQLNFVAGTSDINITVGRETCPLVELQPSYLTCIMPRIRPELAKLNAELQEVEVKIGNIRKKVGYVQYKDNNHGINSEMMVVLSLASIAFVLTSLGAFLICRKITKHIKLRNQRGSICRNPAQTGQGDCSKQRKNSSVYTDMYDTCQPDVYDNILEETGNLYLSGTEQIRIHSSESNELSMPYLEPICHSDHIKGKLAFQIQEEQGNGADVVVKAEAKDSDSYIHPVLCDLTKSELNEEFQSE